VSGQFELFAIWKKQPIAKETLPLPDVLAANQRVEPEERRRAIPETGPKKQPVRWST
jgi:hypothetical protein